VVFVSAVAIAAVIRPAAGILQPEESRLLQSLQGAEIWKCVQRLCTPEYAGRQAGTPGALRAVATMAEQFQRCGLEAPPGATRHQQRFTMKYSLIRSRWDRRVTLSKSGGRRLQLGYPSFPAHACSVRGPAMLLGHGIHRPDQNWDDFRDVRLDGKIAVLWQGDPQGASQPMARRLAEAKQRGALGCMVIARTPIRESGEELEDAGVGGFLPDVPVIQLRRETAIRFFGRPIPAPERRWRPRSLGRVSMRIPPAVDPARPVSNVLGAWTGRDPKLRNEWVVLGAHLDHLGMGPGGRPYHGADDDASGVAVVTAVAEAMARQGLRPRRSILFALWNGEECGLLGSRHFVAQPPISLKRIVGMLQIEMVGSGEPRAFRTNARGGAPRLYTFFESAAQTLNLSLPADDVKGVSDHMPFLRKGVPSLVVTTAGEHPHYHTIHDRPETIHAENLENAARLVALTAWRLAEHDGGVTSSVGPPAEVETP
jgi:hypothetical protein